MRFTAATCTGTAAPGLPPQPAGHRPDAADQDPADQPPRPDDQLQLQGCPPLRPLHDLPPGDRPARLRHRRRRQTDAGGLRRPPAPDRRRYHGRPDGQTSSPAGLYLDANGPHPINSFGCTICHGGQGSGTDFTFASHEPNDLKQKEEWEEEHHWREIHHWDEPMLPARFLRVELPEVPPPGDRRPPGR